MRLVVVTGASAGIGRACASAARERGDVVAVVSRRRSPGDHVLTADLSDPETWPVMAQWVGALVSDAEWEHVDVLHAAATLDPIGPAGHVDAGAYQTNVLLNSAAPQVLGGSFVGSLNRNGLAGCVVMLSSGAARTAYEGWSSYGAGKAAIDQWVRSVGAEQSRRPVPVKVLSVAPGAVATAMQEQIRQTAVDRFPRVERFRELHEQRELADPDDVARRLWTLIHDPTVDPGAVIDLRR
jgi:NAD(P)-dependent dehydrogenase (short-subunit alcohol dehydrogenase family)